MIMGRYRTGTAAMKKYQQLAQQLTEQIALGVWLRRSAAVAARAGDQQRHELYDRQPCLSAAGKPWAHRRPSAVGLLCCPQPVKLRQPAPPAQVTRDEAVDINTYILRCSVPAARRRCCPCLGLSGPASLPAAAAQPLAGAGE